MKNRIIIMSLVIIFGALLFTNAVSNWYISHLFSYVQDSFPKRLTLHTSTLLNMKNVKLKGEDKDNRTNVVVYGLTSDENRTDSILLLSYYWKEKKLVALNIPRDLYINPHLLFASILKYRTFI